jgi:hypothetical protein
VTGAPANKIAGCLSINVDLPGHRAECREVVLIASHDPRESIAAANMTSRALTERPTAIVKRDLRDSAEEILTRHLEPGDLRDYERCDAGAQQVGYAAFGSGESKHAVCGSNQAPSESDPFDLVAVK